jgi:4-amino-4-deoxy-L-arabinose transferase-like glycosyltransferase
MPRVAHWVQNASLELYATATDHQLWAPPGSEILVLNLRLLWGSDKPSNLVQWFSLMAALVGVLAIGREFRLRTTARLAAVGFAAAVPPAVLQATGPQNDVVTALWLLVFGYLALRASRRLLTWWEWIAAGIALGLGMLTKGTFYIFALPFIVWLLWSRPWRAQLGRSAAQILLVAVMAGWVNSPYWLRNLTFSGSPLGSVTYVAEHTTLVAPASSLAETPLRLLRYVLLNVSTPSQRVNDALAGVVRQSYAALGLRESGEGELASAEILPWAFNWNYEDYAGSFGPLLVVLATTARLWLLRKRSPAALSFAACALSGS